MMTLHWASALAALLLGAMQLVTPKGGRRHRWRGWAWVLAMATTAVSSFGIHSFLPIVGTLGPIHLLSAWTLICLALSVLTARQRRIGLHRGFAVGAYAGLLGAGLGALVPGRLIGDWLF